MILNIEFYNFTKCCRSFWGCVMQNMARTTRNKMCLFFNKPFCFNELWVPILELVLSTPNPVTIFKLRSNFVNSSSILLNSNAVVDAFRPNSMFISRNFVIMQSKLVKKKDTYRNRKHFIPSSIITGIEHDHICSIYILCHIMDKNYDVIIPLF